MQIIKMLMKTYLKFLFVALFATMTLSFVSCKDDKDEPNGDNELVGTWDMTKQTSNLLGTTDVDYPKDVYWVFTKTTVTIHDKTDMFNGKTINYTYDSNTNTLNIAGLPVYSITKLTNTELVMTAHLSEGWTQTNEFKKR